MRAHVVLPEDLVREIDRVAAARKRSQFVEAAVRDRLRRERLSAALERTAGSLSSQDYPDWDSPEPVAEWVSRRRRDDDERLARKLGSGTK